MAAAAKGMEEPVRVRLDPQRKRLRNTRLRVPVLAALKPMAISRVRRELRELFDELDDILPPVSISLYETRPLHCKSSP